MGATDVLPYPRRRSSIQLEPMNFQLPGEVQSGSQVQKTVMPQFTRSFVFDRQTSSSEPKTPTLLSPLRVLPRHAFANEQKRSQSSECLRRTRSNSMHRADRPRRGAESRLPSEPTERPSGARRRIASDNDEESTAQFIERIRLELVQQLHRPQEFESIACRRPAVV